MQNTLPLSGSIGDRLVRLSADDEAFFLATEATELPESFLVDTRAQRIGASRSEVMHMRSYDRERELAEEVAFAGLGLQAFARARPTRPDWDLIDAIAKREAAERAREFSEFVRQRAAR